MGLNHSDWTMSVGGTQKRLGLGISEPASVDIAWGGADCAVPLPGHLLMVGLSELWDWLLGMTDQDLGFPSFTTGL